MVLLIRRKDGGTSVMRFPAHIEAALQQLKAGQRAAFYQQEIAKWSAGFPGAYASHEEIQSCAEREAVQPAGGKPAP